MKKIFGILMCLVVWCGVFTSNVWAMDRLKVATYNIGGKRSYTDSELNTLAGFVNTNDLDVLFLQEVRSMDTNSRPAVYMESLNNKLAALGKIYYLWTEDRIVNFYSTQGYIGMSILSKFPYVENTKEAIVVNGSGVPNNVSDPNIRDLLLKVKVKVNDKDVYLFDYHPQPGAGCNTTEFDRVKAKVAEVVNTPVILGGDFNMRQDVCSAVYGALTNATPSLGLTDTCVGANGTLNCGQSNWEPTHIDYIFYTKKSTFFKSHENTTVVNNFDFSDHFPIITNILINTVKLGDATGDGIVNLADFVRWKREFTGALTTKTADFNGDNLVNLADFVVWKKNL